MGWCFGSEVSYVLARSFLRFPLLFSYILQSTGGGDEFQILCSMATIFSLGPEGADKLCPVRIRVQARNPKVDVKQVTPLRIAAKVWNSAPGSKERQKFCLDEKTKKIFDDVEAIRHDIYKRLDEGQALTAAQVKDIVNFHVFSEVRKQEEEEAAFVKAEEAERNRVTLRKFIDQFLLDIKSGKRLSDRGTLYAPSTIRTIKQTCMALRKFEDSVGHVYDFDEIDLSFYRDYTAFLNSRDYSLNTTGKCIKQLKTILALAESEGLNTNPRYKDKRFKGTRVDVDSIYLTKEDLAKIKAVDLSEKTYGYDLARDIFMVGVWTAQRVSDYNNIRPEDIETYTKRMIVDEPDPKHPGKTIEKIVKREVRVINILQKKTGAKVAIPCSTELLQILQKYNYDIPHLSDQNINDNIKKIAEWAGLTENVRITSMRGGKKVVEDIPKYKLVHSHTARRTGATLMYLSGMDIYDIMKITGHKSPEILKKYIKADELEVVDKILDKYDYFD